MLEEAGGFRGYLPKIWIGLTAPLVNEGANFVDDRSSVILLLGSGEPFTFVEYNLLLVRCGSPSFLRLRDGRYELGAATAFDDLLGRLPVRIQFPMPQRAIVR